MGAGEKRYNTCTTHLFQMTQSLCQWRLGGLKQTASGSQQMQLLHCRRCADGHYPRLTGQQWQGCEWNRVKILKWRRQDSIGRQQVLCCQGLYASPDSKQPFLDLSMKWTVCFTDTDWWCPAFSKGTETKMKKRGHFMEKKQERWKEETNKNKKMRKNIQVKTNLLHELRFVLTFFTDLHAGSITV